MTSLLILTPDIPASSSYFISEAGSSPVSPNEQEDFYFYNTMRGERWQKWHSGYSNNNHNGLYYLETAKSADFIVLSKIDYLVDQYPTTTVDYYLENSADNITYSTVVTESIPSLTSLGPTQNDYIKTFTTSSAERYWRVKFKKSAGSPFIHKIGKIYFGTATDLGQDPETYKIDRVFPDDAVFTTDSGATHLARTANSKYRLELTWTGITDAKTKEFIDNVWSNRHTTPVFLYTQTYHDILDNQRLLHCKLLEASIDNINGIPDYNNITAVFEEILG